MRGLIYKDISIFFKSIDKKLILIAAAAIVLLIFNAGIYAGLFTSVMFAMTIGMQNIMSFASDEKASWKKYQLAMPISSFTVVASKYVSVLYTVAISILGSIAFNGLYCEANTAFGLADPCPILPMWQRCLCAFLCRAGTHRLPRRASRLFPKSYQICHQQSAFLCGVQATDRYHERLQNFSALP